jgi:hypothetical protein
MCGKKIVPGALTPPFPFPTITPMDGHRASLNDSDPIEVIEAMTHDARNDAQKALYALLAGAEGCCGPAARNARLAHDDELADFLCKV